MIENLMRKTKVLYRSFYAIYYLIKNRIISNKSKKNIYLDFRKGRFWQSYFFILFSYLKDNYNVYIIINFKSLGGISNHSQKLLRHPNLCGAFFHSGKKSYPLLTDTGASMQSACTKIDHNYFSRASNSISIPFMMHPAQYLYSSYLNIENFRSSEKKIKILFAGNTEKNAYNNNKISSRFNVMTRYEVVSLIQEIIEKDSIILASAQKTFENILLDGSARSKMVIASWEWSSKISINLEAKIKPEKWLPTLAASDFFLALPGITMPFSHNAVEAMSVGCIPILEYGNMFDPPLEDGINSIHFDKSNLAKAINTALIMDDVKIKQISKNVIKYYDSYLRPESLVSSISKAMANGVDIYCIDEVNETSNI
jgi:hypothetical protein